jgi:hypothetical protein
MGTTLAIEKRANCCSLLLSVLEIRSPGPLFGLMVLSPAGR